MGSARDVLSHYLTLILVLRSSCQASSATVCGASLSLERERMKTFSLFRFLRNSKFTKKKKKLWTEEIFQFWPCAQQLVSHESHASWQRSSVVKHRGFLGT